MLCKLMQNLPCNACTGRKQFSVQSGGHLNEVAWHWAAHMFDIRQNWSIWEFDWSGHLRWQRATFSAHPPLLLIFQLLSGFSKDKVNEQRRMCEGEWIALLSKRNKGMFIFIDMGTWYMISCCSNNTPWISYNPVSAVGDLDLKDALSLISADHCWIASLVVLFACSKVITILP